VTAENIGRMATGGSGAKDDTVRLACATADFSVQNVLIQIGLPVLSVDGYRIHSVKHWAQICRGCGAFTRDSEKLFCPKCGNSTLDRVSYTLENGMPVVHDNRRKGPRLKGTIYSIPAPKGGRGEKLLLSEDEMLMGDRARQLRHEQKQFEKERRDNDPWNPDNVYDLTAKWNRPGRVHGSGYPRPTVGAGRKNPNVPTYKWKKK
jgi:RNA-binding protein NOB1